MAHDLTTDTAALDAIKTELPALLEKAAAEYRGRDFVRALAGCSGYICCKVYEESGAARLDFEEEWLRADREGLQPRLNNNRPKINREEGVANLYRQITNLIGQETAVDLVWQTPRGAAIAHILARRLGREARRCFSNINNSGDAWTKIDDDFYDGWRESAGEEQST